MQQDERLSGARVFYVYYLFDEGNRLLYIGRAQNPDLRRAAFERKHGVRVVPGIPQRHSSIEAASEAERAAIRKHNPPYNQKVSSTKGMTGKRHTDDARAAIGAKHAGKVQSQATRDKLRAHRTGKPSAMKGKHFSAEVCAKMKSAAVLREERKRHATR